MAKKKTDTNEEIKETSKPTTAKERVKTEKSIKKIIPR